MHGGRRRFAALVNERLHRLSLARLVRDSPSAEIHLWFACDGANESLKTPDRAAALDCHAFGGSLYFRAPSAVSIEPKLLPWLKQRSASGCAPSQAAATVASQRSMAASTPS